MLVAEKNLRSWISDGEEAYLQGRYLELREQYPEDVHLFRSYVNLFTFATRYVEANSQDEKLLNQDFRHVYSALYLDIRGVDISKDYILQDFMKDKVLPKFRFHTRLAIELLKEAEAVSQLDVDMWPRSQWREFRNLMCLVELAGPRDGD